VPARFLFKQMTRDPRRGEIAEAVHQTDHSDDGLAALAALVAALHVTVAVRALLTTRETVEPQLSLAA
jgi:hypothetical protein